MTGKREKIFSIFPGNLPGLCVFIYEQPKKAGKTMKIDSRILNRFFAGEHTSQEADAIADWIESDPRHKEEFDRAYKVFVLSQMALTSGTVARMQIQKADRKSRILRLTGYAASIAAAVLLGVFINYQLSTKPAEKLIEDTMLVSEAQPGQRSNVILSDGTEIILNSGSRVEYPAIFRDGERRITLDGEAMFDVKHDAEHPFIVETYAYDIKVLGTRFDVIANRETQEFSTALLEGKVSVMDKAGEDKAILLPSQMVSLEEGTLQVSTIRNVQEEHLWTEGVLSVAGVPFDRLMKKMERCYGVRIVIDKEEMPTVGYRRMKVRISEGIEFALNALQRETDFEWRYDDLTQTYHIY